MNFEKFNIWVQIQEDSVSKPDFSPEMYTNILICIYSQLSFALQQTKLSTDEELSETCHREPSVNKASTLHMLSRLSFKQNT